MAKIPKGYTEEDVVRIIKQVSSKLAYKFKFGYHEHSDMEQQAALFAWEALDKYDGRSPLENFLWVHIHNRLFNFKRDNYGRPTKPCLNCPFNAYKNHQCTKYINLLNCEPYEKWHNKNSSKHNLMSTQEHFDANSYHTEDAPQILEQQELVDRIEKELPRELRKDWVKLKNNLKIPKRRRTIILEHIKIILENNDEQR